MTELGRVYQGLMVNVVPANAKLVDRSQRIVQAITGCEREQAAAAWERAGQDIKLAVLLLDGLDPRDRLRPAEGCAMATCAVPASPTDHR